MIPVIIMVLYLRPEAQQQSWYVDRWDNTYGLKSNVTFDIAEDRNGNIWVGTEDGLYRMDGHTLTPLSEILTSPDIPQKFIAQNLYVDVQNRIWIGTYRNGLFCYDQVYGSFKHINNRLIDTSHVPGASVYGIHQDQNGSLMISMHQTGLARYFEESDSFALIVPFTDRNLLAEERHFQLMIKPVKDEYSKAVPHWYFAVTSLVQYVPERDTFVYLNPPEHPVNLGVRSATRDSDGVFWMTTWQRGVWSFNPETQGWFNYRVVEGPDNYRNPLNGSDLQVFNNDHLLIGSAYGRLVLLNRHTGVFTPVYLSVEKNDEPLRVIHMDRDSKGGLWISTYSGLCMYTAEKQQFGKMIRDGHFVDVRRDPKSGTLYLVDYNNKMRVFPPDDRDYIVELRAATGQVEGIVSIEFDSKGQFWIVAEEVVLRYDIPVDRNLQLRAHESYLLPVDVGYIRSSQLDHRDVLWLGTQSGEVVALDLTSGAMKTFDTGGPEKLKYAYSTEAHCIDKNNNIWFSGNGGIFFYDRQKHEFSSSSPLFFVSNGAPIEQTFALAASPDGSIYGASKLSSVYTVPTGPLENTLALRDTASLVLPPYEVRDMLFDWRGRLWLCAEEGVACRDTMGQYHFFGEADGIVQVNKLRLDIDGSILASATGGLYRFHPDSIEAYPNPYNIVLRQFNVFDKLYLDEDGSPVEIGDVAGLTYRENFFSFTFDDVSYRSRNSKQYAYILEGLDAGWVESGVRNYAAYTNVPAGEYTFKVMAKIHDAQKWSEPAELLRIRILPPVWKTPWFIVLCILVVACIVYFAYRYRLNQLQAKQDLIIAFNKQLAETELKALRAQMNPHFLFNVLNAIKLNVQKSEQDKAINFITDFSKLIRSVLQNSEKKCITLREELEALELYISIEKRRFSAEFKYELDTDSVNVDKVMIPPLLLQPYVENAIWHGLMHKTDGEGRLSIHAARNGRGTIIRIIDNGIGRRQAKLLKSKSATTRKSMGMQITSDRMQLSEQRISVELIDLYDGEIAAGTEVIVCLG